MELAPRGCRVEVLPLGLLRNCCDAGRRVTVVIVYPEIEAFGGVERVLLGLCRELEDRGLEPRIVSYFDHIGLHRHAERPLNHLVLNPGQGMWAKSAALKRALSDVSGRTLMFGLQSAAHAELARLDDYSVWVPDTPSLQPVRAASWTKRLAGQARKALFLDLAGRGLRRADGVVTNAIYLGEELRRLFRVEPKIIYLGVPEIASPPRAPAAAASARRSLLSVSRLEPNKRIDWLIRAFEGLRAREDGRPLVLDIAGDGSERASLRSLCDELGLAESVRFHGFVSDETLEALYGQAEIFVMPAVQGFGLPALEALVRDIPVVMHRQSGVSEILGGTPWVSLFDGGIENLRGALTDMLDARETGPFDERSKPSIPTEASFAREIAAHCGWL